MKIIQQMCVKDETALKSAGNYADWFGHFEEVAVRRSGPIFWCTLYVCSHTGAFRKFVDWDSWWQDMCVVFCRFLTQFPVTEMHSVQHFLKARIPLWMNCWSCFFSQQFVIQNCPFAWWIWTWFLRPTRVHFTDNISISSAVFAVLKIVADRLIDRQTDHGTRSVTMGGIYMVVRWCLVIVSCALFYRQMVLTSDTISVKFMMSINISLRTFWTPVVLVFVTTGCSYMSVRRW